MKGRLLLFGAFALSGCTDNDTYTLYRNSPSFADMRIHVASFDTGDGENYKNCQVARELFEKQPGVTVRYWCEKGKYRK